MNFYLKIYICIPFPVKTSGKEKHISRMKMFQEEPKLKGSIFSGFVLIFASLKKIASDFGICSKQDQGGVAEAISSVRGDNRRPPPAAVDPVVSGRDQSTIHF